MSNRPPPPEFEDFVRGLIVLASIGVILLLAYLAFAPDDVMAAEELPPCSSAIPQPPYIVVLPDGAEVPATRIDYELASRRITLIGNPRLFCDGYE